MTSLPDDARRELDRFRFISDSAMEAIYWVREDSSFFYVNSAACRMLGYSREELLKLSVVEIDPAYPLPTWKAHWDNMKRVRFRALDTEHVTAEGERRIVEMQVHFYTFEGDEFIVGTANDVTEQRSKAAELAKETERSEALGRIVEEALDEILIVDADDLKILYANQSAIKNLGYSIAQLTQMSAIDIKPTMDKSQFRDAVRPVEANQNRHASYTTLHERQDGSRYYVEVDLQQTDYRGRKCFVLSAVDVTDTVEATVNLKRTQAAIDTAADAILWIVGDGRIIYANKIACNRLQYTFEELTGLNIADVNPDVESPAVFQAEFWPQVLRQKSMVYDLRHQRKDGSTFPVQIATHLIEYGEEPFACSIVRDMTEKHAEDEQLRQLAASNQAMVDLLSVSDGVWDWQVGSDSMKFAAGFRRILGYEPGNQTDAPDTVQFLKDSLHPDDAEAYWRHVNQCLRPSKVDQPRPFAREHRLKTKDGSYVWVRSRGMPVFDSSGNPIRFVGSSYDITDVRQARLDLEQAKQALDSAADIVAWTDSDGRFLYVNEQACRQWGYSRYELLQRSLQDVDTSFHDAQSYQSQFWAKVVSNSEVLQQSSHRRKDGTEFPVEMAVRILQFDSQKVACAHIRNISDRIALEEARETLSFQLDTALQAGNVGLWDWNVRTNFVGSTATLNTQLGYAPDQPWSFDFFEQLIHPDDRQRALKAIDDYVAGFSENYAETFRLKLASGGYRWIRSQGSAVRNPDGSPARMIGAHVDVHEVRLAQLELQRTSERLQTAMVNGNVGLWEWNCLTDTFFVSDSFRDLLNSSQSEWTLQTLTSLIHPEDRSQVDETLQACTDENQTSFGFRFRLHRQHSGYVWFEWRGRTDFDSEGQSLRMMGVLVDVNDIVVANEELEQFAYVASHDLRSPLRGIRSIVAFVKEDDGDQLSESSQGYLDQLETRVQKMETLIDDLLAYSRANQRVATTEMVNTHELVTEVTQLIEVPPGIDIQVSDALPVLQTALTPLRQVFMNLISNAVKYHDKTDGVIKIYAEQRDSSWAFSVNDNGPGIDPRYHEKIFVIFQRLQTDAQTKGSGMGLAMIQKMVRNFGGEITVESALGAGCTFTFTWPHQRNGNQS